MFVDQPDIVIRMSANLSLLNAFHEAMREIESRQQNWNSITVYMGDYVDDDLQRLDIVIEMLPDGQCSHHAIHHFDGEYSRWLFDSFEERRMSVNNIDYYIADVVDFVLKYEM